MDEERCASTFELADASRAATTVGDVLRSNSGVAPGFHVLRVSLALSIMLYHSYVVSYGTDATMDQLLIRPVTYCFLPIFFALSGFLVMGSALRTKSVGVFLTFRTLRIVPALAVEVTLSALILGPLTTSGSLRSYFTDEKFYEYFGNIIGRVRFELPSVFLTNPNGGVVNANLWTLRPEFFCYAIMAGILVLSLIKPQRFVFIVIAATIGLAIARVFGLIAPFNGFSGPDLTYAFVLGAAGYVWRDKIPLHPLAFWLCAAIAVTTLSWKSLGLESVANIPLTYCMMFLGMTRFPKIRFLETGDYSYGIYLYGYPIQQSIAFCVPGLREWWLLFPAAAFLTVSFATFSWHFIEKPALALRKRFFA